MSVELSKWKTYADAVICWKMRLAMHLRAHLLYAFKSYLSGTVTLC